MPTVVVDERQSARMSKITNDDFYMGMWPLAVGPMMISGLADVFLINKLCFKNKQFLHLLYYTNMYNILLK